MFQLLRRGLPISLTFLCASSDVPPLLPSSPFHFLHRCLSFLFHVLWSCLIFQRSIGCMESGRSDCIVLKPCSSYYTDIMESVLHPSPFYPPYIQYKRRTYFWKGSLRVLARSRIPRTSTDPMAKFTQG